MRYRIEMFNRLKLSDRWGNPQTFQNSDKTFENSSLVRNSRPSLHTWSGLTLPSSIVKGPLKPISWKPAAPSGLTPPSSDRGSTVTYASVDYRPTKQLLSLRGRKLTMFSTQDFRCWYAKVLLFLVFIYRQKNIIATEGEGISETLQTYYTIFMEDE